MRESIFSSALKSFFNAFALILGLFAAIFVAVLIFSTLDNGITSHDKPTVKIGPDSNGSRKTLPDSSPVILHININGIIGELNLTGSKIANLLLDSHEGVFKENRVKGVLIHMNTPGGGANDSDIIYRALMDYKTKYKVPIFTYVEGLCASGGMYIAAATDKIFASSESVIGSVGVLLGPNFNVAESMQKLGIKALTLTEGKDKDTLNPFRQWKPDEGAYLQKILSDLYDRFLFIVTNARPNLDKNKLITDYGAKVFIAQEAQELGFIDDGNSDYNNALRELVKASGISENEKYQVLLIEPKSSIMSELALNKSCLLKGKIKHIFPLGPNITTEMSGKFLYLYQPSN